jgi:hypothetical protein
VESGPGSVRLGTNAGNGVSAPAGNRPLYGAPLKRFIATQARKRGLDPRAVLAVATVEGGFSGAVGDSGTSFGPWQLHVGGALPAGKGKAWAQSRAGINYALRHIALVAKGLTGRRAVTNIVYRFERPAAPATEVQRAMGVYASIHPASGSGPGSRPARARAADPYAWAKALARRFGLTITSTYRPGAVTAAGNVSHHATKGRAADLSGTPAQMAALYAYLAAHRGSVLEAVYQHHIISRGTAGAYAAADHFDHVHVALEKSGKRALGLPSALGGALRVAGGVARNALTGPGGAAGTLAGATASAGLGPISDVATAVSKRETWIRFGEGLAGGLCLAGGIYMLARELGAPLPGAAQVAGLATTVATKGAVSGGGGE